MAEQTATVPAPRTGTSTTRAHDRLVEALEAHGSTVRHRGQDQAQAQCPAHDDRTPSLSLLAIEGRALVHCHAGCATADVVAALGLEMRDLMDAPDRGLMYRYSDGRVVKREYGRGQQRKSMSQLRVPKGDTTTLYRRDEVVAAVQRGDPVALVEGEQDVHAMEAMGAVACCAPQGADQVRKVDTTPLRGARVVVVPDQDEPGQRWARAVYSLLWGVAVEWRRPAAGNDPADHAAAGYGLSDLVATGSPVDTEPEPEPADDGGDPDAPDPDDRTAAVLAEADRLRVQREARRLVDAEQRPATAPPEILTLADRLTRPTPPVTWRVHGWQPAGGRVVLAAQYKSGKTTMVGNLVRCLADGAPWLGRWTVEPVSGTVAVLDLEMSAHQLDRWLSDQGITGTDRVLPIPLRGAASSLDLLDPQRLTWWADTLRQHRVSYLVLDCLRPALDALGLDEAREAGRYLVALDELLRLAGIPEALVVHHMGHHGERSRGDSRIRDWPDAEWRLVREAEEPDTPRYISAYGRDVEQGETRLEWDSETRHLTVAGGSRAEAAHRDALSEMVDALETAGEPLSMRGLETAMRERGTSLSREALRRAVDIGQRDGSVQVTPGARGAKLVSAPVRGTARDCAAAQWRSTAPVRGAPLGARSGAVADTEHTDAETTDRATTAPAQSQTRADATDGCRRWLSDRGARCGAEPIGQWQIGPLCAEHAPESGGQT